MSTQQKELVPGLAGIPAAESAISYIDGQAGILEYRGYPIEQLAEHSTFEETAWLLMHGELPTAAELDAFRRELREHRTPPAGLAGVIRAMPRDGHPMLALQA
ncbi:MAG TPA: citrate/2-methylcitrate synthase, partial [Planctomycetota bacterium]|nr:citrate/2-methylcitrate synthase [Planctomycetota bacterium]